MIRTNLIVRDTAGDVHRAVLEVEDSLVSTFTDRTMVLDIPAEVWRSLGLPDSPADGLVAISDIPTTHIPKTAHILAAGVPWSTFPEKTRAYWRRMEYANTERLSETYGEYLYPYSVGLKCSTPNAHPVASVVLSGDVYTYGMALSSYPENPHLNFKIHLDVISGTLNVVLGSSSWSFSVPTTPNTRTHYAVILNFTYNLATVDLNAEIKYFMNGGLEFFTTLTNIWSDGWSWRPENFSFWSVAIDRPLVYVSTAPTYDDVSTFNPEYHTPDEAIWEIYTKQHQSEQIYWFSSKGIKYIAYEQGEDIKREIFTIEAVNIENIGYKWIKQYEINIKNNENHIEMEPWNFQNWVLKVVEILVQKYRILHVPYWEGMTFQNTTYVVETGRWNFESRADEEMYERLVYGDPDYAVYIQARRTYRISAFWDFDLSIVYIKKQTNRVSTITLSEGLYGRIVDIVAHRNGENVIINILTQEEENEISGDGVWSWFVKSIKINFAPTTPTVSIWQNRLTFYITSGTPIDDPYNTPFSAAMGPIIHHDSGRMMGLIVLIYKHGATRTEGYIVELEGGGIRYDFALQPYGLPRKFAVAGLYLPDSDTYKIVWAGEGQARGISYDPTPDTASDDGGWVAPYIRPTVIPVWENGYEPLWGVGYRSGYVLTNAGFPTSTPDLVRGVYHRLPAPVKILTTVYQHSAHESRLVAVSENGDVYATPRNFVSDVHPVIPPSGITTADSPMFQVEGQYRTFQDHRMVYDAHIPGGFSVSSAPPIPFTTEKKIKVWQFPINTNIYNYFPDSKEYFPPIRVEDVPLPQPPIRAWKGEYWELRHGAVVWELGVESLPSSSEYRDIYAFSYIAEVGFWAETVIAGGGIYRLGEYFDDNALVFSDVRTAETNVQRFTISPVLSATRRLPVYTVWTLEPAEVGELVRVLLPDGGWVRGVVGEWERLEGGAYNLKIYTLERNV